MAESIGGSITIYQKIDEGFVSISSIEQKSTGERNTGTLVLFYSPVGLAISKGRTYIETAEDPLFMFYSAYEPIIHKGTLVGILVVSIETVKDQEKEGIMG